MLNLREESDSALSDGLVSPPRNCGRELPCTGARETNGWSTSLGARKGTEHRVSAGTRTEP